MDALSLRFVIASYALTWIVFVAYGAYVHGALRQSRAAHTAAVDAAASAGRAEESR